MTRPRRLATIAVAVAALVAAACGTDAEVATPTASPTVVTTSPSSSAAPGPAASPAPAGAPESLDEVELSLELVAEGFDSPIGVQAGPDGRIYVTEQAGRVQAFGEDGAVITILDITDRVTAGGERGLLSIAFHPTQALLVAHYSGEAGATTVSTFVLRAGTADPSSEIVRFTTAQPAANHNGGQIAFGPDGTLYIALGDGGGANDQYDNARNPQSVLGTILRIDLDVSEDGRSYGIPQDNPFADGRFGAPEVWAFGLRNPWRFAIDRDLIYIADVGQGTSEEVNVVALSPEGYDFGWSVKEGHDCFKGSRYPCDDAGLTDPVVTYPTQSGCAIIGGVVYRGTAIPHLGEQYFYGDFCEGYVRSFAFDAGAVVGQQDWTPDLGRVRNLAAFGTDADGEILLVSQDGRVLRLVLA